MTTTRLETSRYLDDPASATIPEPVREHTLDPRKRCLWIDRPRTCEYLLFLSTKLSISVEMRGLQFHTWK